MRACFAANLALPPVIVAALLSVSVGTVVHGQNPTHDVGLLGAAFRELIRLANTDVPQFDPVPTYCLGLGRRLSDVRDPPDSLFALLADHEQRLLPSSACTILPLEPGLRYAVRADPSDRVASVLYVAIEGGFARDTVVALSLKHYVGPRWAAVWKCPAVATESGWTVGACRLVELA